MTIKDEDQNAGNTWYQAAKGVTIVAGVFCVIVIGLLVLNYLQKELLDPVRTERLENLKATLLEQPKNEELINTIRQLDMQLRKDRIRRIQFSHRGALLLLGAVAVFLVGIKSAKALKEKLPSPTANTDQQDRQIRQAILARRVAVASLVVLLLAVLFFIGTPVIDFTNAKASYPSDEEIAENWGSFRGPQGSGVSAYTNIPTKWDEKSGQGILWKTPVPLPGHNSPVVWEDRIFLSGANKQKRQVYCFDATSGKLLWQRDVNPPAAAAGGGELDMYEDTGYAASTVATDGRRVCAIFPTGEVACFDLEGKQLWYRNLGTPDSMYGYASSLAMYQNLLLIQYDQASADDNKSTMIALDTFSGMTVWQTNRPVPNSWTSPIVAKVAGESQLITCADPWVIAYDPASGIELWRAECLGTDVAPSPIYAAGLVFAIHPNYSLIAIKPTGTGDVTKTHIAWKASDGIPDICSPVSNGQFIFLLESYGTLTCYNAGDGTKLWEEDLGPSFTASPVLANNKLYLLNEKGVMFIADVEGSYKEIAKSSLNEKCYASPAFADGRIYIRGVENLYCIGEKRKN